MALERDLGPLQWLDVLSFDEAYIGAETADKHGKTLRRQDWSLVVPVHLAESRKEAIEDVRMASGRELTEYFRDNAGESRPRCACRSDRGPYGGAPPVDHRHTGGLHRRH